MRRGLNRISRWKREIQCNTTRCQCCISFDSDDEVDFPIRLRDIVSSQLVRPYTSVTHQNSLGEESGQQTNRTSTVSDQVSSSSRLDITLALPERPTTELHPSPLIPDRPLHHADEDDDHHPILPKRSAARSESAPEAAAETRRISAISSRFVGARQHRYSDSLGSWADAPVDVRAKAPNRNRNSDLIDWKDEPIYDTVDDVRRRKSSSIPREGKVGKALLDDMRKKFDNAPFIRYCTISYVAGCLQLLITPVFISGVQSKWLVEVLGPHVGRETEEKEELAGRVRLFEAWIFVLIQTRISRQ